MDALSLTLTAVADPTRRSILRRLAAGPATVGDLATPYHISQQAVSKHLAVLERARLVEKRREGRLQICRLNPAPFDEVSAWTEECRRLWDANFQRLDTLLEELKARPSKSRPDSRKRTAR